MTEFCAFSTQTSSALFKMKSYPNSPLNYHLDDRYMPRSASRSSCSSTKTSVSKSSAFKSCARLICQLFSDKIGLFILFKVLCCFFISLANFAFNEKLAGLTASMFANSTFDNLLFLEISCWILPLIVYLVWSKVGSLNKLVSDMTIGHRPLCHYAANGCYDQKLNQMISSSPSSSTWSL